MASGIPFGLGTFMVFVSSSFVHEQAMEFVLIFVKLSSISYLLAAYGAGVAASGKLVFSSHL